MKGNGPKQHVGEMDGNFLKSPNGIFKLIQIVIGLALIAMLMWVAILDYHPEPTTAYQNRELEVLYRAFVLFSLAVVVIIWLLTTMLYFMYACSLPKKHGEELPNWCYGGNGFKGLDILVLFNSMVLYLVVVIALSITSAVEPWSLTWQKAPGLLVSLIMASTQLTLIILNLIGVILFT